MNIRVFGLGEIGVRIATNALSLGHSVAGIDSDPFRRAQIESASFEEAVKLRNADSRFTLHDSVPHGLFDLSILAVPTFDEHQGIVSDVVLDVAKSLGRHVGKGEIVAIESTLPPGATSGPVRELLERQSGFRAGEDFYLVSSPERIDTIVAQQIRAIPKIVGGVTAECGLMGVQAYEQLVSEVVLVANSTVAELSKLLENAYRLVNIAFINEFASLVEVLGQDVREVISAAETKPFGYMPFWPSIGAGGHCVPAAGKCLDLIAQTSGIQSQVLRTAVEANDFGPERVARLLGQGDGRRVLVLGLAYKSESESFTESLALKLVSSLANQGFSVLTSDIRRPQNLDAEVGFVDVTSLSGSFDVIIIAAWHSNYEDAMKAVDAPIILDLTGARRKTRFPSRHPLVAAAG